MQRDTAKWLFIAALLGLAFFLWLRFDEIREFVAGIFPSTGMTEASREEQPAVPEAPEKVELKSLHPGPMPGEKVYTEEDIKRLNEQRELPARHPATYTNADLRKYHLRMPTGDIEKMRRELEWTEAPEMKKNVPEKKPTRPRSPSH